MLSEKEITTHQLDNGTIDYDEFVEMMIKREDEEENDDVAQAFKVFDRDVDGLISDDEIRETMNNLGEDLREAELKAIVAKADVNGDGLIVYTEFARLMKNSFGDKILYIYIKSNQKTVSTKECQWLKSCNN